MELGQAAESRLGGREDLFRGRGLRKDLKEVERHSKHLCRKGCAR